MSDRKARSAHEAQRILRELKDNAAAFPPTSVPPSTVRPTRAPRAVSVAEPVPSATPPAPTSPSPADDPASQAGYVPVAVAPERGNTRPVVPVDGRLHMRVTQATLDALDAVIGAWKADHPERRDLERATLVRIGLAMVLADIREHGEDGAVGEAVAAALDPAIRHTATAMPPLERWITPPARSESPAERRILDATAADGESG